MDKNIAKSPAMLEKEAKIEALKKQLKKRKTVLKSLKTRLKNTQESIENIQRDVQSKMFSKMMELDDLRIEIGRLAEKLKTNKHFSKRDREELDKMAQEFLGEELFGEGFTDFREQRQQMEDGEFEFEFGEEERAKMRDVFQQFQEKPSEKEQRNIRKIFLNLSKKFHPDLARTDKEKEQYHTLMQEINAAYTANDIQTLLEMEQMYLVEELDYISKAVTVDMLQEEIERLERDVTFINSQIERTSSEVKNLRQSDMGSMLTQMNKAEREGEGISAMEAELQQSIEMMKQLRAGLKDSDERGSISPILIQMMNPFSGIMGGMGMDDDMFGNMSEDEAEQMTEMAEMLGGLLGIDETEMTGMFGNLFGDDGFSEIENQKFPNGTGVRVKKLVRHEEDKSVKMKGWTGVVREATLNHRDKPVYTIDFDVKTMTEKIPASIIHGLITHGFDFQEYDFAEHQLEVFELEDTEDERIAAYRKIYVPVYWNEVLDYEGVKVFEDILLQEPTLTDEANWELYFKKHLKFPFDAKVLGEFDKRTGTKLKVLGLSHLDEKGFGQIMEVKVGRSRRIEYYPLIDMLPVKKDKNYKVVSNYHVWGEEELEMDFFGF